MYVKYSLKKHVKLSRGSIDLLFGLNLLLVPYLMETKSKGMLWQDCADVQARLNLRSSPKR